jgi:hypothetical protein
MRKNVLLHLVSFTPSTSGLSQLERSQRFMLILSTLTGANASRELESGGLQQLRLADIDRAEKVLKDALDIIRQLSLPRESLTKLRESVESIQQSIPTVRKIVRGQVGLRIFSRIQLLHIYVILLNSSAVESTSGIWACSPPDVRWDDFAEGRLRGRGTES